PCLTRFPYTTLFRSEEEISATALFAGIDLIKKYDEPTLLLFPDGVALKTAEGAADFAALGSLHQQALQCCAQMQDRFALLDLMQGNLPENISQQPIQQFRDHTGINALPYAAAYYPWLISHYEQPLNFRQLNFVDETDTAITDLS